MESALAALSAANAACAHAASINFERASFSGVFQVRDVLRVSVRMLHRGSFWAETKPSIKNGLAIRTGGGPASSSITPQYR